MQAAIQVYGELKDSERPHKRSSISTRFRGQSCAPPGITPSDLRIFGKPNASFKSVKTAFLLSSYRGKERQKWPVLGQSCLGSGQKKLGQREKTPVFIENLAKGNRRYGRCLERTMMTILAILGGAWLGVTLLSCLALGIAASRPIPAPTRSGNALGVSEFVAERRDVQGLMAALSPR